MGRTKRKRARSRQNASNTRNLGATPTLIALQKWLKRHNFSNPLGLQLRDYLDTGRGVTSPKPIQPLDVLLRIPFNLLITFDTVRKSELIGYLNELQPLTIQTLLALFVVMERHKGDKSQWKDYLESLPDPEPFLPWLCQEEVIDRWFPDDFKRPLKELQNNFLKGYENARKALRSDVCCRCCGASLDYLLEIAKFRWGYILVNTRSVYVDPDYLTAEDQSSLDLLADDPFLALCPYMDLINHHYLAKTKANVISIQGETFYQLTTITGFKKYEQLFISYGAHCNEKLLMEYGFFIPGNVFDTVKINLEEVLQVFKVSLDERQYKYIKNHEFDADEVYINENGLSFILKAILFVCFHPDVTNYATYIFSNKYPSDFENSIVYTSTKSLLNFKLSCYQNDVKRGIPSDIEGEKIINSFLEYRVVYVKRLLALLEDGKLSFS